MKRRLCNILALGCVVAVLSLFSSTSEGKGMNTKAKASLQALMDGNARYAAGAPIHPRQGADRRKAVAPQQRPIAVVVSCSDSRVPPEMIFDQGIGDLFVVRVAGNVLDDVTIGSIEYAVEHFGVPLIVVLGHTHCGAVTAAVAGGHAPGHIGSLLEAIAPAVEEAKKTCAEGDLIEAAARHNVLRAVRTLAASVPLLSHRVKEGRLSVVGASYDIESGKVHFEEGDVSRIGTSCNHG